jgi:RNA polymerase sigma-70 factor (ECF subfamily)
MHTLGQRLARGDQAAFAELYDACSNRCHHYAVTVVGTREGAHEVMQETFLRLVRNRQKLAEIADLQAYVFVIARNEAFRYLAQRGRTLERQVSGADLFLEASSNDGSQRELADLVARGLEHLGPLEREVVELKIFGGLTFREIAQVIEAPLQTAASRYRSALDRLKPWLAGQMK